ncbi:MAG: MFS transporter [Mycobacteriales bacterium]
MTPPLSHTFRSFRTRNYRLFATGQLISLVGTWMSTVGQDWLVLSLGGRGVALGIITALQFLPLIFFGMYGGTLADRHPKRRILLCTASASAVLATVLFALVASGNAEIWMVGVLAALLGTVTAIDMPARQSFTVEMVGSDDLVNAVALNSATFNLARILGPAIAGVVIATWDIAPVFALNALSYVAVIIGLRAMQVSDLTPAHRVERARGQFREAVAYVAGRRELLVPVLLVGSLGMFVFNSQINLALMAKEEFHRDAAAYGVLSSALAVGALCGALLSARRGRPSVAVLVSSALLFSAMVVLVGFAPNIVAFAVLLVPMGLLMITFAATANAIVQLNAGEEIRGRVMALYSLVFLGGTPIGAPIIGWLAQRYGARSGLILGGLAGAAATVVITSVLLRTSSRDAVRHPRSFARHLRSAVSATSDAVR